MPAKSMIWKPWNIAAMRTEASAKALNRAWSYRVDAAGMGNGRVAQDISRRVPIEFVPTATCGATGESKPAREIENGNALRFQLSEPARASHRGLAGRFPSCASWNPIKELFRWLWSGSKRARSCSGGISCCQRAKSGFP